MSRQELIWQARAHKCSSRSPLRRLGRRPSRGFERTNDENTVLDCVFISLPLFYIKRAMFNVTDVGISYKKKKCAYANAFNWHFCIFHSIVDSSSQLIVSCLCPH